MNECGGQSHLTSYDIGFKHSVKKSKRPNLVSLHLFALTADLVRGAGKIILQLC